MTQDGGSCHGIPTHPRRAALSASSAAVCRAPAVPPAVTWRHAVVLALLLWSAAAEAATRPPSLFRGVVVADSPLGVRVVSVEDTSQAYLADLRPDDVIVRVHGTDIHSIDEFGMLSLALKGRAVSTKLVVFRHGLPHEMTIHLYSYPILNEWGLSFLPEHDIRFAEGQTGVEYWRRLGRGFEEAGKPEEALDAYLNALHNVPTHFESAVQACALLLQISRQRLGRGELAGGVARLRQASQMLEHLFDFPLTDEQLAAVRGQLQETLRALRDVRVDSPARLSDDHPRVGSGAAAAA